jgi:hypothetical protein
MVKWLKRKIKRIKIKWLIWERDAKFLRSEEEKTEYERLCISICRKLINHSHSKFSIAPISEKKYIINESLGMFVVFQEQNVEITNHVYHYVVRLGARDTTRLNHMFDNKTEKIRLAYEDKIRSQISNSLIKILDKVSENKKTIL